MLRARNGSDLPPFKELSSSAVNTHNFISSDHYLWMSEICDNAGASGDDFGSGR